MSGVSLGWELIGLSGMTLVVTGFVGLLTYLKQSPRMKLVRRTCAGLAIAAAVTLIVTIIVGPGELCGPGTAYKVPSCS